MSLATTLGSSSALNDSLPELKIRLTKKMIIMGAVSSRDWQPIHHDTEYAREQAALPGIIMNNYSQAGWISRYVTDSFGAKCRLGRLKFSMLSPLCPGDEAVFSGVVQSCELSNGIRWLELLVNIHVGERLATKAALRVAVAENDDGFSPWQCDQAQWKP